MRSSLLLCLCLAACDPGAGALIDDETQSGLGWRDDLPDEPVDTGAAALDARYSDATLRIVNPVAGTLLPLNEPTDFVAELTSADGELLPAGDVLWTTSASDEWGGLGEAFAASDLPLGVQELTAEVLLPNGDRLAHTVGGLRVQSLFSGTYAGLYSADGRFQGVTFTCNGSSTLRVNLEGTKATGDGDCLTSLLGIDIPLTFLFELDVLADGTLDGDAGADIFGLLTYDFPASGKIDPSKNRLTLDWAGTVPFVMEVSADLTAPRVSLDP